MDEIFTKYGLLVHLRRGYDEEKVMNCFPVWYRDHIQFVHNTVCCEVCTQYLCGTCVVLVWYLCGTCVVLVWYLCGTCVVLMWYLCGKASSSLLHKCTLSICVSTLCLGIPISFFF